jgi:hypothetical protein
MVEELGRNEGFALGEVLGILLGPALGVFDGVLDDEGGLVGLALG